MSDNRCMASFADAPGILDLASSGAWVAYSVSGGKDSSAAIAATMPILDSIGHPRERRFLLHADLGRSEWKSTGPHVEKLAEHFDLPLHVVRHSSHDMVSRWERRGELGRERWAKGETTNLIGPWSSASLRFCTAELKIHVMSAHKRKHPEPIITVMGIRRDESRGRTRAPFEAIDTGMKRFGREDCMTWNPVAEWSSEDVFDLHRAQGIPLHEAYDLGSTRLSCNFCVLASINDLTIASEQAQNLDTYLELVRMESRFGFSFQPSRWLGDVRPDLLGEALRTDLTRAKKMAMTRKDTEGRYPEAYRARRYGEMDDSAWRQVQEIRTELGAIIGMKNFAKDPRPALGLG